MVRIILVLLILVLVMLTGAISVLGQDALENPVTVLEGEDAIVAYATIIGVSPDTVRQTLLQSSQDFQNGQVTPDGVGGHISPFIPSCTYYNGAAYAAYETSAGGHVVQFHGTDIWRGDGDCNQASCMFVASAPLPFPGDEIWLYSVGALWSNNISNWCSATT